MSRYNNPIPQYTLENGDLAAGGSLAFFESGTNTPLDIFADVNLTAPIANPVTLGSRGEVPNIFYSSSARAVLTDANGNQIFDVDPVGGDRTSGAFSVWDSNVVYSENSIVFGSNGQSYISLVNENEGNDPILNVGNNSFWSGLAQISVWNSAEVYQANELVSLNGVIYKSNISDNQGNDPLADNGSNWQSIADAAFVVYNNVSSGLVATNAQSAIDEIVTLINNLPSSVVYRGQLDVSGGDASLPATPQNGDLYVIAVSGTITVSTAGGAPAPTLVDVGEQIIYNGDELQFDLIAQVTQASSISYNNAISGLTATDVQTAVDEVEARVQANEGDISSNDGDISALQGRADSLEAFESSAGTAFTQDVQTSPTDTTADALMEVGAFGLGTTINGILWANTSINNISGVGSGFYRVDENTTDTPFPNLGNIIFTRALAGVNIHSQIAIRINNNLTDLDEMYLRSADGGTETNPTWSTWKKLIMTSASGNVGIGTDSPSASLEIASVSGNALKVTTGASDFAVEFESADAGSYISFSDITTTSSNSVSVGALGDEMLFFTGTLAAERMRIDDTGNVGIGVTPSAWDLSGGNVLQIDNAFVYSFGADQITMGVNTYFDGTNFRYIDAGSNEASLYSQSSGTHRFSTAPADTAGNVTTLTERMRIDLAGNVGIGTTTPITELHVGNTSTSAPAITIQSSTTGASAINMGDTDINAGRIIYNNNSNLMQFVTNAVEQMRITSTGNVGIGTSSPTADLSVGSTSTTTGSLALRTTRTTFDITPSNSDGGGVLFDLGWAIGGQGSFRWATSGTERMRLDASGRLLVGRTSNFSGAQIEIQKAGTNLLSLNNNSAADGSMINMYKGGSIVSAIGISSSGMTFGAGAGAPERMRIDSSGNLLVGTTTPYGSDGVTIAQTGQIFASRTSTNAVDFNREGTDGGVLLIKKNDATVGALGASGGDFIFGSGASGTERMRIDSIGNMLVGKTATNLATEGVELLPTGIFSTANSNTPLFLNRNTSDGEIIRLRKDNATIGTIGAASSNIYIGQGDAGLYFDAGANAISPINPTTRLNSDNLLDLGKSAARFKDVYAANGTIQTSDIRKKQDIKDLDEAETRVARKAKKLLKSYRWKDAVEAKGDDARIHFGIMAQELEQAFKDEGLDANRYAMFTYDEWVDEKTGEKQDIYGIRYEQLLAFIIGAL